MPSIEAIDITNLLKDMISYPKTLQFKFAGKSIFTGPIPILTMDELKCVKDIVDKLIDQAEHPFKSRTFQIERPTNG